VPSGQAAQHPVELRSHASIRTLALRVGSILNGVYSPARKHQVQVEFWRNGSLLRVLMATLGTRGDLDPCLKIGAALRERGHEVIVISHAVFSQTVREMGFEFHATDTVEGYERVLTHPDCWHWRKNFDVAAEAHILPNVMPIFRKIGELNVPNRTVLVHHPVAMGGRLAHEVLHIPSATVQFAPNWMRSLYHTPMHFPPSVMYWWRGTWAKRTAYRIVDYIMDRNLRPALNVWRKELGLRPIEHIYEWIDSPCRIIGLWPEWFGPPQPDWPSQLILTGFVNDDTSSDFQIETIPHGSTTVVFTAGTGRVHGPRFFWNAVEACRLLGFHALLVTPFSNHIPKNLPPGVSHVRYAPFGALLPRCAAIVHHGGIGTAAQALGAGIPQVILPKAVDQFDNARRLCSLGVARTNFRPLMSPRNLANALRSLIESEQVVESCRRWQSRIDKEQATRHACELIEALGVSVVPVTGRREKPLIPGRTELA
jgi:rhamnosyltransferase subunit B